MRTDLTLKRPYPTRSSKVQALLTSADGSEISELAQWLANVDSQVQQMQTTQQLIVVPPSVNQIWNSDFTHSVNSWGSIATANNGRYECKNFYSHPVVTGQAMFANTTASGLATLNFTDTDVNTGTNVITVTAHGLTTGTGIIFTSSSPPAPLVTTTVYFVISTGTNTIKLATTYANAVAGTAIDLTTAGGAVTDTLSYNYTLKQASHTLYSSEFSDWSFAAPSAGCARFQGDKSIDALIPGGNIQPGYTYYGTFDIVKLNQYVACSSEERIWCGLYAKNSTWDWIHGAFTITATIVGTAPSGTTSRDYVIHTTTDRGFTVQSSVLTVANAPNDASFAAGSRVFLSWKNVLQYGVQVYEIYRKTGATYVLLQKITTGQTSTLDNNGFVETVVGYPAATFDRLVAYTATIPDVIDSLPYSGDPNNPFWSTIPFTLKVPQNYNMGATDLTKYQWLRWGFSSIAGNLDLRLSDGVTVAGSPVVTSAVGQFSTTDPNMAGLSVSITFDNGSGADYTIVSVDSSTQITIFPNAAFNSSAATVYINEGAPAHSIFIDLSHLDFQQGAGWAPAAIDIDGTHGTPPVAPNGTTQGGVGTGPPPGSGDGSPVCLFEDEIVPTDDVLALAKNLTQGMRLPDGYGGWNTVVTVSQGVADVWHLETENGVTLKATETKQIYTPDGKKTLGSLRVGDTIMVSIEDVLYEDKIALKTLMAKDQLVIQIGLRPEHSFLAGGGKGYVVVSNLKPVITTA